MVINYSENTCAMIEIVGLYLRDPSLLAPVGDLGGSHGFQEKRGEDQP